MGSSERELPPFAAREVFGIAVATVVLLLALATRDGYHRDELYFLEASKHLALGYVDQPPVSVLGAWFSRHVFGDGSLLGLRLIPALLDGAAIVLTGLIARELRGERFAQLFAALCVAVSAFLVVGHLAGPTAYDVVTWLAASLIVIRILRTDRQRLWLLCGLVVGIGLEAKDTVLLLFLGLAVGLIINGQWRVLTSPYLWAGALIALLLWAPNLIWDASKGWPTAEMDRQLRAEHSSLGAALKFPWVQLLLPNIVLTPVWIAGLVALLREQRFRSYRPFGYAYMVMFVLLLVVIPDRPYYLAAIYAVLFAAGAIVVDGVVRGRRRLVRAGAPGRRWLWRSPAAALIIALVALVVMLPVALPVLPPSALASVPLQKVNYNLGETIGWQSFVSTVARVYRSQPPAERATAVIFTINYGEAGAIDRFGKAAGLPHAFSGHNSYWWWRRPTVNGATVIAIGFDRDYLLRFWRDVSLATRYHNPWGVDDDEQGAPIWIGRAQRQPWRVIWPELKHYG